MSNKAREGDWWKRAKEPLPVKSKRNRASEQAHVNELCVRGKIERVEWLKRTDELSDTGRWVAEGKL